MVASRTGEEAAIRKIWTWRDMTPMNLSIGSMLHNRTGGWRYLKPVFGEKVPACQNACPAGNDIQGWMRLLQKGEPEEAWRVLKLEQPFPAILGRVCFKFCEGGCNRAKLDQSVGIRELERFLGDRFSPAEEIPETSAADNGKTLAVVGSGPAGMSAACFARMLGFRVTLLERLEAMGGLLRVGIPAYRLPRRIVEAEFERLSGMGIELRVRTEIGLQVSLAELRDSFDYVFLATGAHRSLELRIPGERETGRVMAGLDLLRRVATGEAVDLGNRVVVIGGGNTAIDAARTAVRLGCEVTVLYRRSEEEMPAHPEEIEEAREEGVRFLFLVAPDRVLVGEDGRIRQLVCSEMELGTEDETGRPRPLRKEGTAFSLKPDTVLTAIGEAPAFEYVEGTVESDGRTLRVAPNLLVRGEGGKGGKIFAGGDMIDTSRTVVHAVAAGKRAAIAMDCDLQGIVFSDVTEQITIGRGPGLSFSAYINRDEAPSARRDLREVVEAPAMNFAYFRRAPRVGRPPADAEERKNSFIEIVGGLEAEEALHEADRCMHCGRCTECNNCLIFCPDMSVLYGGDRHAAYRVNLDYCKGCGICANECPRHFVTMVPEDRSEEQET